MPEKSKAPKLAVVIPAGGVGTRFGEPSSRSSSSRSDARPVVAETVELLRAASGP